MDVKAIKLELVQKILETSEESVLEQVRLILDQSTQDWWEMISEEERKAINEGIAQLDSGESVSHEEVMKIVKQKFNILQWGEFTGLHVRSRIIYLF